jgi:hypothetical protein
MFINIKHKFYFQRGQLHQGDVLVGGLPHLHLHAGAAAAGLLRLAHLHPRHHLHRRSCEAGHGQRLSRGHLQHGRLWSRPRQVPATPPASSSGMFLGLLDPHPDPLVKSTAPHADAAPDP